MPFTDPYKFIQPYMDTPVPNISAGVNAGMNLARTGAEIPLNRAHTQLINQQIAQNKQDQMYAEMMMSKLMGGVAPVPQASPVPAQPNPTNQPLNYNRTPSSPSVADIITRGVQPLNYRREAPAPAMPPVLTAPAAAPMPIPQPKPVDPMTAVLNDPNYPKYAAAFKSKYGTDPIEFMRDKKIATERDKMPANATLEDYLMIGAKNGNEKDLLALININDRRSKEGALESDRKVRETESHQTHEDNKLDREQREKDNVAYRNIMTALAANRDKRAGEKIKGFILLSPDKKTQENVTDQDRYDELIKNNWTLAPKPVADKKKLSLYEQRKAAKAAAGSTKESSLKDDLLKNGYNEQQANDYIAEAKRQGKL